MKTVKKIGPSREKVDNVIINKIQDDRRKPSRLIQRESEEEFDLSVSSRLVRRRLNVHRQEKEKI